MNDNVLKDEEPASGYIVDPLADIGAEWSAVTLIHISGLNAVWRAERYGRLFILKGIAPDADRTLALTALRKEFEILCALPREYPLHAISIEEIPEVGVCIVMDFFDGPTLSQWLQSEPSGLKRCNVARRLIQLTEQIHDAGIVHRDLKPDNIIVCGAKMQPVVIDFGLADTFSHTQLKQPAGTPGYISPEQYAATHPDPRNDIYSLGCILRRMSLPLEWRYAIRKTLRPIDRRWQNASDILVSVNRLRRVFRWGMAILAVMLLLAAVFNIASTTSRREADIPTSVAVGADSRIDSLQRLLEFSRRSGDSVVSGLQARLGNLNDSISSERQQALARQQRIDSLLIREQRVLDGIWSRHVSVSGLETPDVASAVMEMNDEISRFLSLHKKSLSAEERNNMLYVLSEKVANCYKQWERSQNQKSSDY